LIQVMGGRTKKGRDESESRRDAIGSRKGGEKGRHGRIGDRETIPTRHRKPECDGSGGGRTGLTRKKPIRPGIPSWAERGGSGGRAAVREGKGRGGVP